MLDVSPALVRHLSRLLAAERRLRVAPARSRKLTCRDQAVLALRWFRDRTRVERLGRDHGVSRGTAYRYVAEAVDVLSAQAPDLPVALMGGAAAGVLADWARLAPGQRKLLLACGGGAGLAAVYNVPLGGALFTAEVMMGTVTLPVVLPALACSGIATVTAWLYLPDHPTYPGVPDYRFTAPLMAWALVAGPLIGLLASGYIRLIGWVTHHAATGKAAVLAPVAAFGILGLIGLGYPQLFGNGKDMAAGAFLGTGGLGLLLVLAALKPLVTALCLGSGASGGLFTPTLSTGAVLGAAIGLAWSLAWPGSPAGAYAIVGAAAMLGAAMQAPLAGLALMLELTSGGFGIMIPMIAATTAATVVARYVDGYSIYSARLRAA